MLGIGSHQPQRVVTSKELAHELGLEAEWIQDRVGIVERRFAAPDESLIDLAVQAGRNALSDAGVAAVEVDAVIVATSSMLSMIPNASARVAQRLGADAAGAFDVNAACAGFCYALAAASDLVRAGSARHALVIGAEKLTDIVDPLDRKTAFLFGDGAGAVLVGQSEEIGIGTAAWSQQGKLADALYLRDNRYVDLDGQAVFRWATTHLPRLTFRALELAGLSITDVDAVVIHQANLRIVKVTEEFLRAKGLRDDAAVAQDIRYSGNTSAASVPIALDHLRREERIDSGDVVVTVAVGAGMTGAGQVLVCP